MINAAAERTTGRTSKWTMYSDRKTKMIRLDEKTTQLFTAPKYIL